MNAPLPAVQESPVGERGGGPRFGSDGVAETLRALDIPFIALNPGARFRPGCSRDG